MTEGESGIEICFNWSTISQTLRYFLPFTNITREEIDARRVTDMVLNLIHETSTPEHKAMGSCSWIKHCVVQLTPEQALTFQTEVTLLSGGDNVPKHTIEDQQIPGYSSSFFLFKGDASTILFLLLGCFAPASDLIDYFDQYASTFHSLPIACGGVASIKGETLTLNTSISPTRNLQDWSFSDIVHQLQCHIWVGD